MAPLYVVLDENNQWQEAPVYVEESDEEEPEDPHENLSQYEIERRDRIHSNEQQLEHWLEQIREARRRTGL